MVGVLNILVHKCALQTMQYRLNIVPIGGTAMGFGTLEYRQYLPSDMTAALWIQGWYGASLMMCL